MKSLYQCPASIVLMMLLSADATAQLRLGWVHELGSFAGTMSAAVDGLYVTESQRSGDHPNYSYSVWMHKYSLEGNLLWTQLIVGASFVEHIRASGDGVYALWSTYDEGQRSGYCVYKLDPNGKSLWTRCFSLSPSEHLVDASAATDGVYVLVAREGPFPENQRSSTFVHKYDGNGNEVWTRQVGGELSPRGVSAAADGVYVSGVTVVYKFGWPAGDDAFIGKYDLNGNLLWTHQFDVLDITAAEEVRDGGDGVYLKVSSVNFSVLPQPYVQKYSPAGQLLWTEQLASRSYNRGYNLSACCISASPEGLFAAVHGNYTIYGVSVTAPFVRHYDPGGDLVAGVALSAFLSEYFDLQSIDASGDHVYAIGYRRSSLSYSDPKHAFLMMLVSEPKSTRPVSWMLPYWPGPNAEYPSFVVYWSGSQSGGPAIQDYTIYVSDDGGAFTPWMTQTTATEGTFTGLPGHTYGFYSIARNQAGVYERAKTAAEITTSVLHGPSSHVSPLAATQLSNSFLVQWSGTHSGGGTIQNYTIYVSDNGGPFVLWRRTSATQSTFPGVYGHTYGFYSIARDTAGREEHSKTVAEASTRVADAVKPVSHVSDLPATASSPNLLVQWFGTATGTTIRDYAIYVSDDGGSFTPWLSQTAATKAWYSGRLGHSYRFFSIARDNNGNTENMKSGAEAATQVPAVLPADVNGDLRVDCSDVGVVKASLGKKTGQIGFDERADINRDGVIDIRDLAAVTQKLAPTPGCS